MITTEIHLPVLHPFNGMDVSTALVERAEQFGNKDFLVWEPQGGHGRSWTYRQFSDDVDRVAAGLHARGVQPGDGIMLLLDNSPAFLLVWFACARIGAVAVDTNTRYASDELRHAIQVTGVVGIVAHQSRLASLLEPIIHSVGWVESVEDDTGICPDLFGNPAELPERTPDPTAPLCIQFTSGTTSRPKAVLFTHANALWGGAVGARHGGFSAEDVSLVFAPLFHTGALSWQFLSTFWVGGTVILLPKYSASRFWEISLRHRCTVTYLLGIMLETLATQEVPEHHYRKWIFGLELPEVEERYHVRLFSGWGMTETVTQPIVNSELYPSDDRSVGRVALEYRIKVLGPGGTDARIGEPGELWVHGIRGLSLFAEYLRDDEATANAFDSDGYFDTGDRVMLLPSGSIRFVGRAKDMLKVGGENVATGEIERVLLSVPGVQQAAVVGRPNRILDEVPVGFIVVSAGADNEAVRESTFDACHRKLADFKMPRDIYVIDELPEATLGKIAKGTLTTLAKELATQSTADLS